MAEDRPSRKSQTVAPEVDLTAEGASPDAVETSIDAVTREAEALLEAMEEPTGDRRSTDDLVADVERTLDLVDALVDEASPRGSSVAPGSTSDAEDPATDPPKTTPPDLDLTVTLPQAPVDPDDQVPVHGAEGPSVDLFARPDPDPAAEAIPEANPRLIFDEDRRTGPVPESGRSSPSEEDALLRAMTEEFGSAPNELPATPEPRKTLETPVTGRRSSRDAAASRLQQLLTTRLAEEYDSVEELGGRPPSVRESVGEEAVDGAGNDPGVIESASSEERIDRSKDGPLAAEDVGATNVLPDASEFDLEERSAVEREATLEFIEPVLPRAASKILKDAATTSPKVAESTAAASTTTPTVAEVPAPEIGSFPSGTPEDAETPPMIETEVVPDVAEVAEVAEDAAGVASRMVDVGDSMPASEPDPKPTSRSTTSPATVVDPRPEANGTEEDRETKHGELDPGLSSRLATPLALSLVVWVPLVWGYALIAPGPDPSVTEVLPVGISEPTVDPAAEPSESNRPTPSATD